MRREIKVNLLVTGAWLQAKDYIRLIRECGHSVEFLQHEVDDLPCSSEWVQGIIGNGIFLNHPIECFPNLQYIQLTSAGFDRVPMKYVVEHDIVIKNARGVYSVPMSEFAVAGVLSLYKRQRFFSDNQKKCLWEKRRDLQELFGRTVSILGCGSVGTECAKRFRAFGCKVIGVDSSERKDKNYDFIHSMCAIKHVLSETDIAVVTLPLTADTRHLFNADLFSAMKEDSIIVNIARGAVIDTEALIDALQNKLKGAVLDVFEDEPLGDSPLWNMENVIITPHNSFVGDGNNERMSRVILENLGVQL